MFGDITSIGLIWVWSATEKFLLQNQQLLPTIPHTFLNLTQHEEMEKEATVEVIAGGGDGGQPDTTALVMLLLGGLLLFLLYLGLKYYTTESLRWIKDYFLLTALFHWSDAANAAAERQRREKSRLGRDDRAARFLAWLLSLPGSILQTT